MVHRMHGDALEQFLGHILKVFDILVRDDHMLEAARHARQNLLLDAAHGQHPALQGDLAGHAQVCAHTPSAQGGDEGRGQRNARRGAVLGRCARRHVHVQVVLRHKPGVNAKLFRTAADVAQGRLGAFLHHIAKLPGEGKATLALHDSGFNRQHFAASRCPGQAQSHAGHELLFLFVFNKAGCAQQLFHIGHIDHKGRLFALGLTPGQFAADGGKLAFKVAQPCLARIFADDLFQGFFRQFHILGGKAVVFHLLGQQMLARDLGLFLQGVTRQGNDFHTVAQGRRNGFQMVGRAEEHNL